MRIMASQSLPLFPIWPFRGRSIARCPNVAVQERASDAITAVGDGSSLTLFAGLPKRQPVRIERLNCPGVAAKRRRNARVMWL